jgi:hypothetical protein
MCDCELCDTASKTASLEISLSWYRNRRVLTTTYKYPGDIEKEIAYQEGLLAGYFFKLNELSKYKVIKTMPK